MVHAKNYETVSTFVKVIQRKVLASFFRKRCIYGTTYVMYATCNKLQRRACRPFLDQD